MKNKKFLLFYKTIMKTLKNWGFESLNIKIDYKPKEYNYFLSFGTIRNFFNKIKFFRNRGKRINYENYKMSIKYNLYLKLVEGDEINYKFDTNYWNVLYFLFVIFEQGEKKGEKYTIQIEETNTNTQQIIKVNYFDIEKGKVDDILSFVINLNQPEKFGLMYIKIHGRFEQYLKYINNETGKEIMEAYKDFLYNSGYNCITRVDYFFDYNSTIEEEYKNTKIDQRDPWFFGEKTTVVNKELNICGNDTIYWGNSKNKTILIRNYSKYTDSHKKHKLYLYPYVEKDTRRMEIECGANFLNKNVKKGLKSTNINSIEFIQIVYKKLINSITEEGKKVYSFNFETPENIFSNMFELNENFMDIKIDNKQLEKISKKKENKKSDMEYIAKVLVNKLKDYTKKQRIEFYEKIENIIENGYLEEGNSGIKIKFI